MSFTAFSIAAGLNNRSEIDYLINDVTRMLYLFGFYLDEVMILSG